MKTNLPTTPGQHWFKEEGKDNWQPYYVTTLDGEGMICHKSAFNVTSRCLVSEMPSGQWLPAPSPDELATLRAKAEAYDKGQTTNGVFSETTGKIVCVISTPTKDLAPGYTCRKVRVCEVVG